MKSKYMIFALGLLTGLVLFKLFLNEETPITSSVTTYETETIIDCVTYYEEIQVPRDSLVLRVVDVAPSEEPEKYDSVRTYRGAERFAYGLINWKATTGGTLQALELSPEITLPITTTTNTIRTTETIVRKPRGLYGAAGTSDRFAYRVGATYLNDKSMVGYRYEPQTRGHYLEIGFKIF